MESLSSVGTIVRIAQDIAGAVATVSRNRDRCQKLAKRVKGIGDLLRELDAAEAGTTDAATRCLLGRLEEALRRALQLVRSCQDSSCPRRFITGKQMVDRFDEVDGEIDHCLLDLGVANRILITDLKRLLHQNAVRYHDPAVGMETVTLRIGMPCDDRADNIRRCIGTMKGVMDVSPAAATNDQFMVTVLSGAVDIPSLLGQVKQKLNRNVELVAPAATGRNAAGAGVKTYSGDEHHKKANHKTILGIDDKQTHSSMYAGSDEIKKEKAPANIHQQTPLPPPYTYLPFAVALVPVGDASSIHHTPSPYSFLPYPQGPPGSHPVHAQRQSNPHRVNNIKKYDSGGYIKNAVNDGGDKDEKKGKFSIDDGARKKADTVPIMDSGKRKDGDKTVGATGNVTAIGVPVHTVTAGVHELVPPPSYGYGYWPYAHGHGSGPCCHNNAGGPSDAAAYNYNHNSSYPDMFSDENPNAYCSIM